MVATEGDVEPLEWPFPNVVDPSHSTRFTYGMTYEERMEIITYSTKTNYAKLVSSPA